MEIIMELNNREVIALSETLATVSFVINTVAFTTLFLVSMLVIRVNVSVVTWTDNFILIAFITASFGAVTSLLIKQHLYALETWIKLAATQMKCVVCTPSIHVDGKTHYITNYPCA